MPAWKNRAMQPSSSLQFLKAQSGRKSTAYFDSVPAARKGHDCARWNDLFGLSSSEYIYLYMLCIQRLYINQNGVKPANEQEHLVILQFSFVGLACLFWMLKHLYKDVPLLLLWLTALKSYCMLRTGYQVAYIIHVLYSFKPT